MSDFVDVVNKNGVKQTVPAAWLEADSPFADQFKLPPSAKDEAPKPDQKPKA